MAKVVPLDKRLLADRMEVATFLRKLARLVETGEVAAEAVALVVSAGDVHRTYWTGYHAWDLLGTAARELGDGVFAKQHGWKQDPPEQRAANRLILRQRAAQAKAEERAAKPFACVCGQRFATERGFQQHLNLAARQRYPREHGRAEEPPREGLRAL